MVQRVLADTQAQNGLVVVTEAAHPLGQQLRFVPHAKINLFTAKLQQKPWGQHLAEELLAMLHDCFGGSSKPVLLLQADGHHWLGKIDLHPRARKLAHDIDHLKRCLSRTS